MLPDARFPSRTSFGSAPRFSVWSFVEGFALWEHSTATATNQNKKPREPQNTTKNTATQEHTNPKKRQNNQNTAIVSAKQTKPRMQSPELGQFLCSCRPSDRWQTTNQTNHHHAANTPHHKKPTKPTQYNNQFKSKTGAMGRRVRHTAGNT